MYNHTMEAEKSRHRSFSSDDENDIEIPPPHNFQHSSLKIDPIADVDANGRVSITIDEAVARRFSQLIPSLSSTSFDEPRALPRSWAIPLNVVIQVVGSRGDVQPFVALGKELQKSLHRVRIATHPKFEVVVRAAGLDFYSIGGDPEELMAYMVKNPSLLPNMKSLRDGDIQRKRNMIAEMLEGCWKSCLEPTSDGEPFVVDAIIANPPSFAHVHVAQALGVPIHLMFTMPWTSTEQYPHPLANIQYSGVQKSIANRLSYFIVEFLTWQGLGDVINKFRERLGLEPVPSAEGPALTEILDIPTTYCWSPALMPKPTDWSSNISVCGFFSQRLAEDFAPPPDIMEFLKSGSRPIYIGFGSIVLEDPIEMTEVLLKAIKTCGVRAIISRGWSKLYSNIYSPDVLFIDDCPHEWLFQHVSAVIHHGGAGTTACGLLNSCPTTIVPFFGDQPFWGSMVAERGAGPTPIPWKALDAASLTSAINFCLSSEAKLAAESIATKMRLETGVKTAVNVFHSYLPLERLPCQILADRPAVWTYGKDSLRLSALAAEVLVEKGRIRAKDLKLLKTKPIYINPRRWEPLTAGSSALLGTAGNMLNSAVGIVKDPYDVYRRHDRDTAADPEHRTAALGAGTLEQASSTKHHNSNPVAQKDKASGRTPKAGNELPTSLRAFGASAKSIGMFNVSLFKGTMVDMPLAITEGLRAVPKLYGEDVQRHGYVDSWKSGGEVAGKTFAHGMVGGFSDLVKLPIEEAKVGGALGFAKGVGKGTLGFTSKTTAAMLGLVAYTGQGICKSIHRSVYSSTHDQIVQSRRQEGQYILSQTDNHAVREEVDRRFSTITYTYASS